MVDSLPPKPPASPFDILDAAERTALKNILFKSLQGNREGFQGNQDSLVTALVKLAPELRGTQGFVDRIPLFDLMRSSEPMTPAEMARHLRNSSLAEKIEKIKPFQAVLEFQSAARQATKDKPLFDHRGTAKPRSPQSHSARQKISRRARRKHPRP